MLAYENSLSFMYNAKWYELKLVLYLGNQKTYGMKCTSTSCPSGYFPRVVEHPSLHEIEAKIQLDNPIKTWVIFQLHSLMELYSELVKYCQRAHSLIGGRSSIYIPCKGKEGTKLHFVEVRSKWKYFNLCPCLMHVDCGHKNYDTTLDKPWWPCAYII